VAAARRARTVHPVGTSSPTKTAPQLDDPLKCRGDALLKQGRAARGAQACDEAAKYAPNWAALKNAPAAAAK